MHVYWFWPVYASIILNAKCLLKFVDSLAGLLRDQLGPCGYGERMRQCQQLYSYGVISVSPQSLR